MPRPFAFIPAAGLAAGLLLADALPVSPAAAQGIAPDESALRPQLDGDPRNPARFGRPAPFRPSRFVPASYGTPPGIGTGVTGFKSRYRPRRAATLRSPPKAPPVAEARPSPQLSRRGARANAQSPLPPVSAGSAPPHRRPRPEEDPYAPLGLRAGAFVLRPAVEVMIGHDSNPQRTNKAEPSTVMTVAPELLVRSNWSRHALDADIRGTYTKYFQDFVPELTRPLVDSKVQGRIDVTSLTRLDLEGRFLLATDNPGSPNISAGLARLPFFTRTGVTVGAGQKFNRFEVAARARVDRTAFQDSTLTDGSRANNNDRNFNEYGGTLRGSYEMTPGVKPFLEAGLDTRVHDIEIDRTGMRRDSVGSTVRVGTTFELSHKLTGEISGGHLTRDYEDASLRALHGLIFDASLIWKASALTTVTLTAKSTADEVIVAGVSGVLRRDFTLAIDHAFRRRLIGTVKVGFGSDGYVGSSREDERYALSAGLTYKLTRTAQIKAEIRRDWQRSSVFGADYSATTYLAGFRLQQ